MGENEVGEVEWPQGVKGENGEGVVLVGGQQQEEPWPHQQQLLSNDSTWCACISAPCSWYPMKAGKML